MPPRTKKTKAAKAAADPAADATAAPTDTQTAPAADASSSWSLTADQAKSYRVGVLMAHAEGEDGEMTDVSLEAWGAQQSLGWHPEMREVLISEHLLVQEPGQTVLTAAGWKRVMTLRTEAHELVIARKDCELAAHREYALGEQQLLKVIDAKAAAVDSAKGSLNLAKEALKQAHDNLAAHCAGGPQANGVQQSLLNVPGVMPAAAKDGGPLASDWKKMLPGVEPDRVVVYDGADKGMPEQQQVLDAVLLPIVFDGDKRVIDTEKALKIFDHPCIVTACWHDPVLHESRANLTRLYTVKEWVSRFAQTLGQAVEGQDQTEDAKRQRQTEGAWCGLQIRVGNKTMVVGPQSQALHIVHPAPVVPNEPDEPGHDGKAAAAGDVPEANDDGHEDENGSEND